jgi:predicted lipid-binding transport protein (Tim44 family)
MIAVVLATLLSGSVAYASRPGGGQTYSGSSQSSGDSSSDDSDAGAAIELLVLVIKLIIRFPIAGSAVVIIGLLFVVALSAGGSNWESVSKTMHAPAAIVAPVRPSLTAITARDPDFSPVLFEDFVFRLYAAAQTARGAAGQLDELAPYVSASARRALAEREPVNQPVSGVVIGKMAITRVTVPPAEESGEDFKSFVKVGIQFEANYTVGSAPGSRRFVVEDWLLRREAGVRSKPPDPARRFACPNCGAPWRGETAGGTQKCASCGSVVDNGRFDWQVEDIKVRRESANIPGLDADVPEQGTALATVIDPQLADAWTALTQSDPQVTSAAIAARLEYIYRLVNDAWSRNDLTSARPVLSDGLADYLQYWIDAYAASGLRNALDDMRLTKHEPAKLARDRYYDALTIRIWATGKDYVVRADRSDGAVVRGSKDADRAYSEYWTLIRSSARRGAPRADATCGSCGAALTVTMAGACEHCGSHVTAGEFDWVLSKIEQDEAY